jgi:integrase
MLDRILRQLKKEGKITTTNPQHMTRADIQAFIHWMKTRPPKPLDPDAQNKYLRFVEKVCAFAGNPVVQSLRDDGERLPMRTPRDIRSLDMSDLERIQAAADKLEGWTGEVARFMAYIYPYTGLRPSELRRAQIRDIDLADWTIWVRHPKGEMKYGKKRTVIILPPAREPTLRFLRARENYLRAHGVSHADPLIPTIVGKVVKPYSANRLRVIKTKLEREAGVTFALKDFRSTFAQLNIDRDPTLLQDVSKAMGHRDTRTTENFYGRIQDRAALLRLEVAWTATKAPETPEKEESVVHGAEKGKIDSRFEMSGYA